MKTLLTGAAIAALGLSLSACATAAKVNEALIPQFKPIEARIATSKTCGDMVREAMGSFGQAAPETAVPFTADQAMRLVQLCEQRDKDGSLTLDPQAARAALHNSIIGGGAVPGAPIP